nr:hypothetical protein CFP56_31990 [Quercus suber]
MFTIDLVNGYEEIHVFMDHLVDKPVEVEVEDIEPLDVREPSVEHVGAKVDNAQALDVLDPKVVVDDHVGYAGYEDEVYFDGTDDGPVEDSSETGGSDIEEEPELHPTRMNIGDSWDTENIEVEPVQIGVGVLNSDYGSDELLSLDESSFDNDHGDDSSDDDNPAAKVDNSLKRSKFPVFRR